MKNPTHILLIIILSVIITLVGCKDQSEEEVVEEALDIAEKTFTSLQTVTPNTELGHLSLYLPKHIKADEVDENNMILSDAKQTYILFYNELEEPTSELNYQMAETDGALLLETFQSPEKFGYIRILTEEDNGYQIQIGVGGVKITTYTTKKEIVNHAEELMKIALSIE